MQQKTTTVGTTIGEFLLRLSMSEESGKEPIKDILEKLIQKYPEEIGVFEFLINEASKGKKQTILKRGTLIPDFSKENITSKVDNGCVIVSWND